MIESLYTYDTFVINHMYISHKQKYYNTSLNSSYHYLIALLIVTCSLTHYKNVNSNTSLWDNKCLQSVIHFSLNLTLSQISTSPSVNSPIRYLIKCLKQPPASKDPFHIPMKYEQTQ